MVGILVRILSLGAIFTPGPAVSTVSGRVGGTIFSRNRGGAYMRNGAVPSVVRTEKALVQKAIFTAASQAWSALTAAQQLAWTIWARTQSTTNRLGKSITLTGQAQFVGLSARLMTVGEDIVVTPPITPAPATMVATAFTVDAGTGDTELTLADATVGTNNRLYLRGAKVNSSGINNVENLLTTVDISAKNAASPIDLEAALIAAFGALQEGAYYILEARAVDTRTGLASGKFYIRTQCVSTP